MDGLLMTAVMHIAHHSQANVGKQQIKQTEVSRIEVHVKMHSR